MKYVSGFVHDCGILIANAVQIPQYFAEPSEIDHERI